MLASAVAAANQKPSPASNPVRGNVNVGGGPLVMEWEAMGEAAFPEREACHVELTEESIEPDRRSFSLTAEEIVVGDRLCAPILVENRAGRSWPPGEFHIHVSFALPEGATVNDFNVEFHNGDVWMEAPLEQDGATREVYWPLMTELDGHASLLVPFRVTFHVAGENTFVLQAFRNVPLESDEPVQPDGPAFAGSLVGTPTAGGETTLLISVEDQDGNPISGLVLADFTLRVGDAVGSDCTGVDGATVVFPDGRFNGFVDHGDGTYTLVFQETPGDYCFDIEVDGTEIVTDQLIVVEDVAIGSIVMLNQPRDRVQAGEHVTTATGQNLRVRVRDQFHNPMAGVTVEATAESETGGTGTLEDTPQEATTDANGIATFVDLPDRRLVINDPDDYRLRFAVNGVSVTTNLFTVFEPVVAVPTVANPSLAGSDLEADGGGPLVVTVTDGTDPLVGVAVTASLIVVAGPGALSGTLTLTTDGDGQATFADLQVDSAGTYQLAFTVAGVESLTNEFEVTP